MIVLCHPWLRKELKFLRSYFNLLIYDIRYIVVEKRPKTYVADINLVFVWEIVCHYNVLYKNNGSWGLHHGQGMRNKERGMRNGEQGMRNENCTRTRHRQQGPANGANVEIFSNSFCMH
jgi:hypothetical protein